MDFKAAKENNENDLEIDPRHVKTWAQKGDIEAAAKENQRVI